MAPNRRPLGPPPRPVSPTSSSQPASQPVPGPVYGPTAGQGTAYVAAVMALAADPVPPRGEIVGCPRCLSRSLLIRPTRRGGWSLHARCLHCGQLSGFVHSPLALAMLRAWGRVYAHTVLVAQLQDALGLAPIDDRPIDVVTACPVCTGRGATLRPDVRGNPYIAHRLCVSRLFLAPGPTSWMWANAWATMTADDAMWATLGETLGTALAHPEMSWGAAADAPEEAQSPRPPRVRRAPWPTR